MKSLEEINREIAKTEVEISEMSIKVQASQSQFEEDIFVSQMLQLIRKRNALRWVTE